MEHPTITECDDSQCVVAPFWLREAKSVQRCPLCHCNVYNCGAGPDGPLWRRIAPAFETCRQPEISIGDWVHIVEGQYQGFNATIDDLNPADQIARIILHLIGGFFPFWIELRALHLIESKQ